MSLAFYVSSEVPFNEGGKWRCHDGYEWNLFVQADSLPVQYILEYSVIYYSRGVTDCKCLSVPE